MLKMDDYMAIFKKPKDADMNDFQVRQMELVVKLVEACKLSLHEGECHLVIGALSTALATIMASMLNGADKDVAMDGINEILNDIKKGTFLQIEMIEKMGKCPTLCH